MTLKIAQFKSNSIIYLDKYDIIYDNIEALIFNNKYCKDDKVKGKFISHYSRIYGGGFIGNSTLEWNGKNIN